MQRSLIKTLRLSLFLASLFWGVSHGRAWSEVPQGNSCIACHLDYWEEMKGSVHSRQGIYCQNCHGGDASQSDQALAKAEGTGYVGVPDKKQLVEKCGACHADVGLMNFYGVRTDQLAAYKTSRHGKMLFEKGETDVAGCSDCHGYHDVVEVSDPASPVYPLNLPNTCEQCHGNEKLMSKHGLPSNQFELYKNSVHGRALFEKKDTSVAHCASCHGSHGALPPGVKEIGSACGKCHVNEKKYFLESVHSGHAAEGKFSECVSCHGNHNVQKPSIELYKEACAKCHQPGTPAAKTAEHIYGVLQHSRGGLQAAEALVKQASVEGMFVEEENGALEEAKTDFIVMAGLQHSLSVERISELYKKFDDLSKDITSKVLQKRRNLSWRKAALVPLWIFVLVMAAALWAKFKQMKSSHE